MNRLKQNQMTASREKLHAILIRKDQTNTSGENLIIKEELIKLEETVKLLGICLDYKLNFKKQVSEICRKAASQFNVLRKLKRFVAFDEKILVQSFIYSNFDYCPLVWYFSSANSLQEIEKSMNVPLDFCIMTNLVHTAIYFRSQEGVLCMFSHKNSCALKFSKL